MGRASGAGRTGPGRRTAAIRRAAHLAVPALLAVGGLAAPARAQTADVPASNSTVDILRWVNERTSIQPSLILVVEPRAVVALNARISMQPGSIARAELREELLSPDAKTRSALFEVDLDCTTHKYRIAQRRMYPQPDLKGPALVDPQPRAWAAVDDSAPVGKAWQSACTQTFVFPFAAQPAAAPVQPAAPAKTPAATRVRKSAAPAAPREAAAPAPPATSGPYEAVLGAYTVKANAAAASDKLDRLLAPALAGRTKALHATTVNGKLFTVLTVGGFAGPSDAARFCSAARAIKLECVPKRTGG